MQSSASPEFVDTHCHLNFTAFDDDRNSVIERARANGITRILVPGIDIASSRTAIECANEFPEVYAAVGVHPNDGTSWTENTIIELRKLAVREKVVAIGEIGLDYYRNYTPRELQKSIFQQQLELAAETGLPVIIHNREASDDILSILREWHSELLTHNSSIVHHPGVMHSFSGGVTFAKLIVSLNLQVGITGPVTFPKSFTLQSVVSSLPCESLFIETDAPYLAPQPYRGKRNEPANVRIVAEKIAAIKGLSVEKVAEITTAGANKLFKWREMH